MRSGPTFTDLLDSTMWCSDLYGLVPISHSLVFCFCSVISFILVDLFLEIRSTLDWKTTLVGGIFILLRPEYTCSHAFWLLLIRVNEVAFSDVYNTGYMIKCV